MRRFDRLAEGVGRVMGALVALPMAVPPVLAVVFSALLVGAVCAVNCVLLLPLAAVRRGWRWLRR
jgi:hypothetical protein